MSRLSQATTAVRPSLKARMLISGPQGSGKTRGALIIAFALAGDGKVLLIDTEKESGLSYADEFPPFTHLPWRPPFHPGELGETLAEAGKEYGVVIVDSVSHFWQKEGGTLDIAAGKFSNWKDARPIQERFIEGVLTCGAHVILCARAKNEYVQETDTRGKQVVRLIGMGIKQDDDLAYEVNVALELDQAHNATVTKSRTTVLPVLEVWPGNRWGELAERYKDWLAGGEPPADAKEIEELVARLNALPERARKEAKGEWLAKLGRPETLRASQLDAARDLVSQWTDPPEQQTSAVEGGDHPSPPTTAEEVSAPPGSESAPQSRDEDGVEHVARDGASEPTVAATPSEEAPKAGSAPIHTSEATNQAALTATAPATGDEVPEGFVSWHYARSLLAGHAATTGNPAAKTPQAATELAEFALASHGLGPVSRDDLDKMLAKVEPAQEGDDEFAPSESPSTLAERAANIADTQRRSRPAPRQMGLVD